MFLCSSADAPGGPRCDPKAVGFRTRTARSTHDADCAVLHPNPPANDCGVYCGENSTMETIQVVLDAKLLKAADMAAKQQHVNRSELIRRALREHLGRLREAALEERDRRGYQAQPQRMEEYRPWEEVAAWPED